MKSDGWVWTDVKNCNRKQKICVLCREVANWKKISKISRWVHWIPSYSTYLNNYLQIAHAEDLEASQSGILSFIILASQRTKKFGLTESHTMYWTLPHICILLCYKNYGFEVHVPPGCSVYDKIMPSIAIQCVLLKSFESFCGILYLPNCLYLYVLFA